MGYLKRFDIKLISQEYNLQTFIETGTGLGAAIKYAATVPFKKLLSCEIMYDLATPLKEQFIIDERIKIVVAESELFLPWAIKQAEGNILFWLDAHFPGADLMGRSYLTNDPLISMPLERELALIKKLRPDNRDYFIIDDLRMYEPNNKYGNGGCPEIIKHYNPGNLDFLVQSFDKSHTIARDLNDEGYILMAPKEK